MTQREQRVALGVLAVCFTVLAGTACGDDGGSDQNVGDQGGSSGAAGAAGGSDGGTSGSSAGGSSGSANGGSSNGGTSSGGSANGGTGGSGQQAAANPDEVVQAACDWEFRCCDDGERAFRLSPFAVDASTCAERLIFQMHESNATANPYVSGSAAPGGLLGSLGYVVNLSRVEVNAAGVAECKEYWESLGCSTEPDPDARCDGAPGADPCALTNLFAPTLQIGAECTAALTEGGIYNDVECSSGSTCLAAGHPDNPNDVPTCVKRGLQDEPCTQDTDCDFNFACSSSGNCTEKGDAGEACSFNDPSEPAPGDEDIQCKAGLSCNPLTLQCVESCTLGFTCATNGSDADLACPAESGCAPAEVAEATTAFRLCTALGNSAASRCNSDLDCVATRYCDGSVCQSDKTNGATCGAQNECAAGLHCDVNDTGTCVNNLTATTACASDFQCGPGSAGCLNQGTDGLACRNAKLPNGDECGDGVACASGRCELASDDAVVTTCVAGATAGADCDTVPSDGDALSCRPGLLCFGETGAPASGTCVQQASAGTSCENPDQDADNDMCANGSSCVEQWEQDLCTDQAVSEVNGGSGLTCDGA
jgi:hypothetical protein